MVKRLRDAFHLEAQENKTKSEPRKIREKMKNPRSVTQPEGKIFLIEENKDLNIFFLFTYTCTLVFQ